MPSWKLTSPPAGPGARTTTSAVPAPPRTAARWWLLHSIQRLAWCAMLLALVRVTAVSGEYSLLVAWLPLMVWAAHGLMPRYLRAANSRRAAAEEVARLEGITLAARTLRHHVGNKLAVTVGYTELLADDPRLPEELEDQATKAMTSAMAAARELHQLDSRVRRIVLDTRVAGPPLLDIPASTAPAAPDDTRGG